MQKRCKLHSGRVYVASLRPLAAGHALFWRQKLRLVGFFFFFRSEIVNVFIVCNEDLLGLMSKEELFFPGSCMRSRTFEFAHTKPKLNEINFAMFLSSPYFLVFFSNITVIFS